MYEWNLWAVGLFIFLGLMVLINFVLCFVFAFGGFFDLRYLLKSLKEAQVDETDDGRVVQDRTEN